MQVAVMRCDTEEPVLLDVSRIVIINDGDGDRRIKVVRRVGNPIVHPKKFVDGSRALGYIKSKQSGDVFDFTEDIAV